MKTVHKLILKSYAGPMVLTFFIVLFVFIMQFMWRYIDELVGKGLGMDVILELMMYAAVTLIPMVLPLATLFAAVMTMGNMGENYELLALKSAGISLPKIMRPLIILVLFVAVGSFFVANNLVPIATKKSPPCCTISVSRNSRSNSRTGCFSTAWTTSASGWTVRTPKRNF